MVDNGVPSHINSPLTFFQVLMIKKMTVTLISVRRTAFKVIDLVGVGNGVPGHIHLSTDLLPDVEDIYEDVIYENWGKENSLRSDSHGGDRSFLVTFISLQTIFQMWTLRLRLKTAEARPTCFLVSLQW